MYKSKEQQKEANKRANREYRKRAKGITEQGITEKGITEEKCPESVTLSDGQVWHPDPRYWRPKVEKKESEYPAVVQAVVNNREKMEAITMELKAHHVSDIVRYGIEGPTFDVVGEILDCVK